jgi:hypothetical protein
MRAPKADRNQAEIVDALRVVGCTVQHLHMVGKGCPDILVGRQGVNYLLEIKDGKLPTSGRKLTDPESDWHRDWRGSVAIVCTVREAMEAVGIPFRGFIS